MPTNRQRRTRKLATISLSQLSIMEQICLMTGWSPGEKIGSCRWQTWEEFYADSDAVKDELMADTANRQQYGVGTELFADRLRRELAARPGDVYEKHGGWKGHMGTYIAIRHAHVRVPGDKHKHEGRYGDDEGEENDVLPAGGRELALAGVQEAD